MCIVGGRQGLDLPIVVAAGRRSVPRRGPSVRSWFNLLLWSALALQLAGMAILSTRSLPPASASQRTLVAPADGWTFPPGCLSR